MPAASPRSARVLLPLLIAMAAAWMPASAASAEMTVDALGDCVRANFPATTSIQQMLFRSTDRAGATREIRGRTWWKRFDDDRSRVLVRVAEPADLRGSAFLMAERKSGSDLFLYVPELKKVRRITSQSLSGSLFGSDFTYEDFQYVQGLATDGETRLLDDTELDGVPVHVSEHLPPADSGSMYTRIVSQVEKERCLPIRNEFYEGERLRKVMTIDREKLHETDGIRIPSWVKMEDRLNESQTTLEVVEIEVGVPIKRRVFDLATLERGGP